MAKFNEENSEKKLDMDSIKSLTEKFISKEKELD